MIKFIRMHWSNVFSYGENNTIEFNNCALTQLVGKNGHGKSSIPSILEEVLFNTNSKKIKKGDVLNRYVKDKNYKITVEFEKDGTLYSISTNRTTTTSTVILTRDGVDISSHTATGTYKTIESILGYDFKTFSQIVYQSSLSSLEFLTATDTARKKFLIDLFDLTKYTSAGEVFKKLAVSITKDIDMLEGKLSTITSWLSNYSKEDLSIKDVLIEPTSPKILEDELALLRNDLVHADTLNKRIIQNNKYKEILNSIVLDIPPPTRPNTTALTTYTVRTADIRKQLQEGNALSKVHKGPHKNCPTCNQIMDNSTMYNMVLDFQQKQPILEIELQQLLTKITKLESEERTYLASLDRSKEWEKYHSLIDKTLQEVPLDKEHLQTRINVLQKDINNINSEISKIRVQNKIIEAHNSKVKVLTDQMQKMLEEETKITTSLDELNKKLGNVQVLVKTFGTDGLVAYKIEGLVKDLENATNYYLGMLADGRFQLSFKITASDKLNVVITDNGRDIDIVALSSGERARVTVSTLLAIRKLMQTISNSRTNLLILDETIENLDAEGKDKLIEVLLLEQDLNTFLISHGFSHPLLEKLHIIKDNNISRIEG